MRNLRRLFSLTVAGLLLLATGCGTTQRLYDPFDPATGLPPKTPEPIMRFSSPMEASAFLTMPGDILLMHLGDSRAEGWIKQLGMYPAAFVDILDLQDPGVKYLHAEVVTDLKNGKWIMTRGFYPLIKTYDENQFYKSWTTLAVHQTPSQIVSALQRAKGNDYPKTGYCGDFVAWCFGDQIYSWWNRAASVQKFIKFLWFPSAIDTADNLENSPDTSIASEVQGDKWVYPFRVETPVLLQRLSHAIATGNPDSVTHANRVLARLKAESIVSPDGQVIVPAFRLDVPDGNRP